MDRPPDELQGDRPGRAHLRAISPDNLRQTLAVHQAWVRSRGKEGKRAELGAADLSRAPLRLAVLVEAHLQGADLERAVLEGARMQRADLQRACLRGADLQRASMQQANLQGADLFEANLEEATLTEANLSAANLLEANLSRADLERANLQRAFMKQALLEGTNLQAANLLGSNLQQANLQEADLRRAVLREANLAGSLLRGADLQGADLQGSHLQGATLQQATLKDTNLTGTTGLVASQLAGTDLAGTKLPEALGAFTSLEVVRHLTRQARHLFAANLLACLLVCLCIAATQDVALLTNAPISLFSGLQLPISSAFFYHVAPVLLCGVYIYFHLHLQRLWEEVAALPAIFPDGRAVDRVVYPWLLHGMIRRYAESLRQHRPPLSRLQTTLGAVLAWWIVPLTLILIWVRHLPRHSWSTTLWHMAMVVSAVAFMVLFQSLARDTLRGRAIRRYKYGALAVLAAVACHTVMSLLSLGALNGIPPDIYSRQSAPVSGPARLVEMDLRRLVPLVLTLLHASPFADLTEAEVSKKPPQWSADAGGFEAVQGASLKERNLRYANAQGAFLVNADLRRATLAGADLRQADLRGAVLADVDLSGTLLYGADLRFTTGLTLEQLAGAHTDASTRLPDALDTDMQR